MNDAIADTRAWFEKAVIGLNLCPFAKAVQAKDQIRWVLSAATTPTALLQDLVTELQQLAAADPAVTDTTLLVHPGVLGDFLDFNDFLGVADAALADLGLEGTLQIASFHPRYQFAGSAPDDMGNFSNRSPTPRCTCCARTASNVRWPHTPTPRRSTAATSGRWKS
jgi:hypothetical protein